MQKHHVSNPTKVCIGIEITWKIYMIRIFYIFFWHELTKDLIVSSLWSLCSLNCQAKEATKHRPKEITHLLTKDWLLQRKIIHRKIYIILSFFVQIITSVLARTSQTKYLTNALAGYGLGYFHKLGCSNSKLTPSNFRVI